MNGEQQPNRESRIREVAYFIWESEGRPDGEAERHWAAAEEQVDSGADDEAAGGGARAAGTAGGERRSDRPAS